jgi:dihydroorotase
MAKRVARAKNIPLMTHHALSSVDLHGCPGSLAPGDIYTHTYHGWASTITPTGGSDAAKLTVHEACIAARKVGLCGSGVEVSSLSVSSSSSLTHTQNGVIFDVGHGAGAFNWRVAEVACEQGFFPDVISTDLHMVRRERE